jgi:hypothetical protein
MVKFTTPGLLNLMVCELLVPVATLPKLTLEGMAEISAALEEELLAALLAGAPAPVTPPQPDIHTVPDTKRMAKKNALQNRRDANLLVSLVRDCLGPRPS